jgi:pimeloyl-ACP methyl ester carboxylesterase
MQKSYTITYPYSVKKLTISNDIEMAYMDEGSGDNTLVFIHGLANYAAAWKFQLAELSKTYRCIALDLPGNGQSSKGEYPYSMFFYAESVKLFLEKLGIQHAILCGHSMGGQVAMIMALRYPQMVEKLVLIAPAGIERFSGTDILFMQAMLNLGDFLYADELHLESAIRDSFETQSPEMPLMIAEIKKLMNNQPLRQWRQMTLQSIQGMLNEQVHAFLTDIKQPVLVIFGTKDRLIPNKLWHPHLTVESLAIQAEGLFDQATMALIDGGGHFVHVEFSTEVNKKISNFIAT